jgi:hypothetical protein
MKAEGRIKDRPSPHSALCLLPSVFIVALFLTTAAIRIPGIFTEFWGDEIWSWSIAGQLHSVMDVLLAAPAHIDNNHLLNTLWLYLVGQNQPVWLYRLPALVAGIGSVAVAGRIMMRLGRVEAIIAILLLGFSYPLIFYSSEARGYSFAVFFSLLSFDFLQQALADSPQKKLANELLFGLACMAGFLSHLTFLHIYAGALVWSMVRVRRLEPTTRLRALRLARLHAIPLISALLLFHFFVHDMVVGGAPPTSPPAVFLQTLSLTAGGTDAGLLAVIAAVMAGGFFIAGLLYLAEREEGGGTAEWTFFLVAVAIAPALACTRDLCFSLHPQPLMPRYFLVCISMLLLSACPLLAWIWRRGYLARRILAAMSFVYLLGNGRQMEKFLALGRGHYGEALAQIASQTADSNIAISSDNPIRTNMLIQFYGQRIAPGREIRVDTESHSWLILNRYEVDANPTFSYGNHLYSLISVYRYAGFSGWAWDVYRLQEPGER